MILDRRGFDRGKRLVQAAGALAVLASLGLGASLVVREGARVTVINMTILALPSLAGILAFVWPHRISVLLVAETLLLAAMTLLYLGGAAILYLPSLLMMTIGLVLTARHRGAVSSQ